MANQSSQSSILKKFLESQDRLVFQGSDLSLGTIHNMVTKGAIDVNPTYQRRERWSRDKQSALIESFLLNVPVPPIYLTEDEFGRYSVVDGKQRITSIHAFMSNGLSLNHLESFKEIDNYKFTDLPLDLQNALEVRPYLRVITLLKQSDPTLKFEVFTRLNSGGESMAAQELRNVAFRGPLNDLIFGLSTHPFLKKQLKIKDTRSAAHQNMTDVELVLRFLTLKSRWRIFNGDYRAEMDTFMIRHRDSSVAELELFASDFQSSISLCEKIWGDLAFKRPVGESWRDQLLTGMYDAQMVASSLINLERRQSVAANSSRIIHATKNLFDDEVFDAAVRQGTNNPSRVRYRISKILELLT